MVSSSGGAAEATAAAEAPGSTRTPTRVEQPGMMASAISPLGTSSVTRPAKKSGSKLQGLWSKSVRSITKKKKKSKKNKKKNRGGSGSSDEDNESYVSTPTPSITVERTANVVEDDFLKAATASATGGAAGDDRASEEHLLDIVVLVMDPASHRFELLQIEFEDATMAKVSDLLLQLPMSITEPLLQRITYDSILDPTNSRSLIPNTTTPGGGTPSTNGDNNKIDTKKKNIILPSSRLIEVFSGSSSSSSSSTNNSDTTDPKKKNTTTKTKLVLVARPNTISDEMTLKLARPIFSNNDVSKMLELSGFDITGWKALPSSRQKKKKKNIISPSAHHDSANETTSLLPKSPSMTNIDNDNDDSVKKNTLVSLVLLCIVVVILIGYLINIVALKPIPTNTLVRFSSMPKSKCGLFGYVTYYATPKIKSSIQTGIIAIMSHTKYPLSDTLAQFPNFLSCEDEFMVVTKTKNAKDAKKEEGIVIVYDAQKEISMVFTGGNICSTDNDDGSNTCINGLMMNDDDHTLEMGGTLMKQVLIRNKTSSRSHGDHTLSPWPFEDEPTKLKYKIASSFKAYL